MFINISFTEIRFLSKNEFRSEKEQNFNSGDKESKLKKKTIIILKNQKRKINIRVLHFCFKF